jgi:phosphate starvation-inducible protein PhoH
MANVQIFSRIDLLTGQKDQRTVRSTDTATVSPTTEKQELIMRTIAFIALAAGFGAAAATGSPWALLPILLLAPIVIR